MTERLTVKRYEPCNTKFGVGVAEEEEGEFMRYTDHQAVVAELEAKLQQATEREAKLREAIEYEKGFLGVCVCAQIEVTGHKTKLPCRFCRLETALAHNPKG